MDRTERIGLQIEEEMDLIVMENVEHCRKPLRRRW